MAKGKNVQVDLKDIYKRLCPKCRTQMEELLWDKAGPVLVRQMMGLEDKEDKEDKDE